MKKLITISIITTTSFVFAGSFNLRQTDFSYDDYYSYSEPTSCNFSSELTLGYDFFRGPAEGSYEGNTGALVSINFAGTTSACSRMGLGTQVGGSYGVYDWNGNSASLSSNGIQQQGFVTGGIFRTPGNCFNGFSGAIAYDLMLNSNFGVFALNPLLMQLRLSASSSFCKSQEIGLWGTIPLNTDNQCTDGIPVQFKAVGQVSLFWQHYFANTAKTMFWIGIPYQNSLILTNGWHGRFLVGTDINAALSTNLEFVGHAMYYHIPTKTGIAPHLNYGANIMIGLTYYFKTKGAVSDEDDETYNRRVFRPYLPLANNSNFLTDSNLNF